MLRKSLVCLWATLCFVLSISEQGIAQNQSPRLQQFFEEQQLFRGEQYEGNYYLLIQFTDLPAKSQTDLLAQKRIHLLSYYSNNTYLAAIPSHIQEKDLADLGIVDINRLRGTKKLSPTLRNGDFPHWAVPANGQLEVVIKVSAKLPVEAVRTYLQSHGVQLSDKQLMKGRFHFGQIAQNQLEAIAALPLVQHIDAIEEPIQALNRETCLMQRVNMLNSGFAGLPQLNGAGVVVGVGDGGELGNHLDFDGRVINKASGTYSSFGAHGDHVAGIIGGNGSVNPRHRGMASECTLLIEKTSLVTYYTEDYYNEDEMVLTNNSYGTSFNCNSNGTYNYSSQNLDWQMREFPELLHVFAAGNS
ncbi:MAG: S8 family serine peptidase, partial [Bacteroidota bacterium]